jgi:hypothetical protein
LSVRTPWIALLAAGATAAALAAPAWSTAPERAPPAAYSVTLTGSQRTVVTRTGTRTDDAGCTFRAADRDSRTIVFGTRKRMSIALGSQLPTLRFAPNAQVQGTRHRKATLVTPAGGCAAPPPKDTSCGPVKVPVRLAVGSVRSRVRLTGGFARARDRARCATTLTHADPFVVTSGSRLTGSPAGAPRIFVHAHLVRRTTLGAVTQTTIVDWRLVLRRV